jgi:CubicO group peptidase (beta-lactamase class C family)
MSGFARKLTAAAIAMSLLAVPTGAIAGAAPPTAAPTASASPWVKLSAMTSTSSSAAAAAVQGEDGPGFPPIAPLVVILGTIALAVYILTKDDDDEDLGLPVSPD